LVKRKIEEERLVVEKESKTKRRWQVSGWCDWQTNGHTIGTRPEEERKVKRLRGSEGIGCRFLLPISALL